MLVGGGVCVGIWTNESFLMLCQRPWAGGQRLDIWSREFEPRKKEVVQGATEHAKRRYETC